MAWIKYKDMILSPEEFKDVVRFEKLQEMESRKRVWAVLGFIFAIAIGYSISYFLGVSYYITIPISIILGRVLNGIFRLLLKIAIVIAIIVFIVFAIIE